MQPSEKSSMNKRIFKYSKRNKDNIGNLKDKKKGMKLSRLRKKRLIIRNLSFKVNEEQLKKIFSKFGEVLEVKIPLKSDGKKRGFAFVEFSDSKPMIKAMKELNFQKINGRPVAIDFAVNKDTYLSWQNNSNSNSKLNSTKQQIKSKIETDDSDNKSITESKYNSKQEIKSEVETKDSDDESLNSESKSQEITDTDDDAKNKAFLKEFDADHEEEPNTYESDSSAEFSEDEKELSSSSKQTTCRYSLTTSKLHKKKQSEDVSDGKTVFIRNISFRNNEDDLQEVVGEIGETVYCLFCIDPITGHFRGTAFVRFKEKKSAEKLIEESSKEPGILLDGRKLLCTVAVSRENLSKERNGSEKNRDKRNLRLLKCGLVAYGSKEAEGVSQADMAKRAQLEAVKKQKLKNVNFFVSDKRLICHNIPKNINDKDLYKMFKKAGGKDSIIKEVRVMKDFKKTDAQGNPASRGFAFITFTEHEHALRALNELNNNSNTFTANKRPIVEFSVENKVALLSQDRRREKIKMLNKKRMEQANFQSSQAANDQQLLETVNLKKKQKKGKRNQKQVQERSGLSALSQIYKEKLLNKFS